MAIIGTFTPTKDGGWSGAIRTLTIDVKAKFVPNDNRDNDRAPAFRIFAGRSELGAAWVQKTKDEIPRGYLSVQIDDPSLPEPISAAMFHGKYDEEAQLVWHRR
ncbi:MAG: DUF736 domain-containing protein [Terriglobia bacterium]|nr:DUF736 domain-containing protein [Terriglobia bacterium]